MFSCCHPPTPSRLSAEDPFLAHPFFITSCFPSPSNHPLWYLFQLIQLLSYQVVITSFKSKKKLQKTRLFSSFADIAGWVVVAASSHVLVLESRPSPFVSIVAPKPRRTRIGPSSGTSYREILGLWKISPAVIVGFFLEIIRFPLVAGALLKILFNHH